MKWTTVGQDKTNKLLHEFQVETIHPGGILFRCVKKSEVPVCVPDDCSVGIKASERTHSQTTNR